MKHQEYWTTRDIFRHIPKHVYVYHRNHGTFPQPLQTLVGKTRWKRETVEKWIEEYMEQRKRWKSIDPVIRLFLDEDSGTYIMFPPAQGLALDFDGVAMHALALNAKEMVLHGKSIRITQCPDHPRCKICQTYDFNLRAQLAMHKEIER